MTRTSYVFFGFIIFFAAAVALFSAGSASLFATHEGAFDFTIVRAENVMGDGAQIKWTTNGAGDSKVVYGVSPGNYPYTAINRCDAGGYITDHCINLTGLGSGTTYYYKAKSDSSTGAMGTSVEYSFMSGSSSSSVGCGTYITQPTCTAVTSCSWNTAGNYCYASTTSSSMPSAPTGLYASVSGTSVTLTWVDNSTNESEFKIHEGLNGATPLYYTMVGPNILTYSRTAAPTGTHNYQVAACNSYGCTYSGTVSATVSGGVNMPLAPSNLQASLLTNDTVSLTWTDNSTNEDNFKIYRGITAAAQDELITTLGMNIVSYTHSGVPNGSYYYVVKACNTAGCASSSTAYVNVTGGFTVPAAPTGLSATCSAGSQCRDAYLTWTDNSADETEFKIYNRLSGSVTWSYIGMMTGVNITYYTYFNAPAGTNEFYVIACNTSGCSGTSNVAMVAISSPTTGGTSPAAPTNLVSDSFNGIDAYLKWYDNSMNESEFKIYWRLSGGSWSYLASAPASTGSSTTYTHMNIPLGTNEYYVIACNSYGCSSGSNTTSVTRSSSPTVSASVGLTSPNGGQCYVPGASIPISFSYGGSVHHVAFYYDLTGTGTSKQLIADSIFTSPYSWVVPNSASSTARLWVEGHDSAHAFLLADSSDSSFSISSNCPTTPADTTAPTVLKFGYSTQTDGRVRVDAGFSESMDPGTLNSGNVQIIRVSDNSIMQGTITVYASGVDYLTSGPLQSGVNYQLLVKRYVKDLAGNQMTADYLSAMFQGAGTMTTGTFSVDVGNTFPKNGEAGTPTSARIQVRFNNTLAIPASGTWFFSLAPLSSPAASITGNITYVSNGFDFTPSTALAPNTTYTYTVYAALKDTNGNMLSSPYSASFTTGGTTTISTATVRGKITDSLGNPVGMAYVQVRTSDYLLTRWSESSSNGEYGIYDIPVGSYIVEAYPPKDQPNLLKPAWVSVTLMSGEIMVQDFKFGKGVKTIKGKVVRSDGRAVTDADVEAYQSATSGWARVKTDGGGNYSMIVTGGWWDVRIFPNSTAPDWNYSGGPKNVQFLQDSTVEERVVDFTVTTADAIVKGKIVKPDGTVPTPTDIAVDFRNSTGGGFSGPIDTTGAFLVSLPAGTYTVFIHSRNSAYSSPTLAPITIVTGQTIDMGTIKLISQSDKIQGKVTDQSGKGIAGVRVNAWVPDGMGWAEAMTDTYGAFTLLVTAGTWDVQAMPDPSSNYYQSNPPQRITVYSGAVATLNFILYASDAGISGTVVDSAGTVLSDLYGWVSLNLSSPTTTSLSALATPVPASAAGGSIERGQFSFKAPAGTYQLFVYLPPDSSYIVSSSLTVTLYSGKITSVKVTASKNTSMIVGFLKSDAGSVITGIEAEVFATTQFGTWQNARVDKSTGKYSMNVSAGTWYLGYHIDPASGYISSDKPSVTVTVAEGQTVQQDIIARKAGSVLTGSVTDPAGTGVAQAFVMVSKASFGSGSTTDGTFKDLFVAGAETDSFGNYRVSLPAGSFFVKAFVRPELGYLGSDEKYITIADGQTLTLNLALRKSSVKITGKVYAGSTAIANAYIWGWSETGGWQQTASRIDGSYELGVTPNTKWLITAATQIGRELYKSGEIPVAVGASDVAQNIDLAKISALPEPITQTVDATTTTVVKVENGTMVSAPANSVSTSGSVTITISPDTRVASQGEIKVVGTAYDMEARDTSGKVVSSFNSEVTVSIPYTDADVTGLGAKEDNLTMAYWDETVGTWKTLDNSVVNKEKKLVTSTTSHFTRFAVVAPADIVPPAAPTTITAVAQGGGAILVSWTNPTSDFRHTKIYRSTTSGQLGSVAYNEVSGTSKSDTGLTNGTTYYYTVRAVDPAGNESVNTVQVSATATGTGTSIVDGDLIRAEGTFDIFIAKLVGTKKFKRLILNPAIFDSYGHLRWDAVKDIPQTTVDSFGLSETVMEIYANGTVVNGKVYQLTSEPNSDVGVKRWLNITASQFEGRGHDWDAIYKINHTEAGANFYPEGTAITS